MFPSKYVCGDDLKGKPFVLTIDRIKREEMFDVQTQKKTHKWVLYFKDAHKGVLLGKTQAKEIAEAVGSQNSDDWVGSKVEMYPTKIRAFGKIWNTVRFRKLTGKAGSVAPDTLQVVGEDEPEIEGGEEVDMTTGEIIGSDHNQVPFWDLVESELSELERIPTLTSFESFIAKWEEKFDSLKDDQKRDLNKRLNTLKSKTMKGV
jgi:hypothetical protein